MSLLEYIKSKLMLLDAHTKEVAFKSFASTIVKVLGMFASVIVTVILGRALGADGLGVISLANQIVSILVILCFLGMHHVIIKKTSIYYDNKKFSQITDVIKSSTLLIGGLTLIVVVIILSNQRKIVIDIFNEKDLKTPLLFFSLTLIPQMLSRIFSAGLIGYRKIWQSNLVDQALSTFITLIIIVLLHFNNTLTILTTTIAYVVGRIIVTLTVGVYWRHIHSAQGTKNNLIPYLLKQSIPLYIASLSTVINANSSSIILGIYENSTQVGLFTIASRIALLTSFFLQISNSALAPKVSSLFQNDDKEPLRIMIQKTTLGLFVIGLISFLLFALVGKNILSLWGGEFKSAYLILLILSFSQFVNIATGPASLLLIMCGFAKIRGNISIVTVLINLFLNVVLIQLYGGIGAAVAMATTIVFENLSILLIAYKKTGILTLSLKLNRKQISK